MIYHHPNRPSSWRYSIFWPRCRALQRLAGQALLANCDWLMPLLARCGPTISSIFDDQDMLGFGMSPEMVTSDFGTIYLWFGTWSNLPKSLNEHNFEYHLEHQWQRSFIVIETSKRLDQFNQFQHVWPSTSSGFLCTNPWLTKQIHGSRS